ncbi:Hypothetical predicted protein [Mytilus galloprovincialis]|uniref:C1q domain-containing protein n=1 Tax=Mytilus galloprovincialis TaxID=29158 RepID=A0A8B6DUU9_MYTGA|nr:Hypothetical predicted protein [Mytilus galloprovincialis]
MEDFIYIIIVLQARTTGYYDCVGYDWWCPAGYSCAGYPTSYKYYSNYSYYTYDDASSNIDVSNSSFACTFTVTLPSGIQTRSADSRVRYDQIIYNPLNEYNPTTGIFTIGERLDGVYPLSVSMMPGRVTAHTTLMKNGEILVWLFTNNSYDMASQSIIIDLSAGDKIWVQIANSGSSLFSVYNTFSALQIRPIGGFSVAVLPS